ncbi:MAG TPA: hypothetical protein VHZ95_12090 [Polyangiales bacterium]|nr:hypothetical protein [Polyangiales bacterium]
MRAKALLLMASVAALACFRSSDGDLGFHLATGRAILASGHIPSTNVLSFGEPEHAWLLHQWLPAVLFEWLWQRSGITALIVLKMIVVSATWLMVLGCARRLGASLNASVFVCLFAATASAFRFEIRPYLFTHLTLAATLFCVLSWTASRRVGFLIGAIACCVIGSQLHAGALDSYLVVGAYGLGCVIESAPRDRLREVRRWSLVVLAAISGSAILLALYNPWGARVLLFPFAMIGQPYFAEHLVEFRHAWSFPISALAAYWCWLLVVVFALVRGFRSNHVGLLLIAVMYALASLTWVRMVFAFAIVSAPLVAQIVSNLELRLRASLVTSSLVLLAGVAPLYVYRDHEPGFGLSSYVWPVDQFRFMRAHAVRGRAFVSDAWAGPYLGFFYPERRAFFDGRLEAYSTSFAIDVYQRIRYAEPGWDALLDRYRIDVLLLRYTTAGEAARQRGRPNVRQLLAADARYALVNFDDVGELFVRRTPDNATWISDLAIPGVDPDRRVFLAKPALGARALVRAAERGNHASTLLGLTALALADAGDSSHAATLMQAASRQAPDDVWLATLRSRLPP